MSYNATQCQNLNVIGHARYINILSWLCGFQKSLLSLNSQKRLGHKENTVVLHPFDNIDISDLAYCNELSVINQLLRK